MPFSETVAGTLAGDELQDSASSVLPRGFWLLAKEAAKEGLCCRFHLSYLLISFYKRFILGGVSI